MERNRRNETLRGLLRFGIGTGLGVLLVGAPILVAYIIKRNIDSKCQKSYNYTPVYYNIKGEQIHLSRYQLPIDPRGFLGLENMDPDIDRCELKRY